MADVIVLAHAAATLAMVGVIWFVQIVHYPLFDSVGRESFSRYEESHQRRTTLVVAPLMSTEALTAAALFIWPPDRTSHWGPVLGLFLLAIIWGSTFFIQVPAHTRLQASFEATTHRRLVRSNWIRTAAWTARGGLALWFLA